MANVLEVILKGDAKHLNSSLGRASRSLKSFGSQVTDVGKNLSLKLSAPLALVGAKALQSTINFEKLQTQLDVLTGSAEAGADAFERLVKFSAGTPFQLDELVKANNTLMGFGVSAEDAFQHLQAIGDIAAVSGGDLQGISVAFGQVAAAGRLMGQDLLQLINNGVPIIDMLSQSMGVAKSEIKDMVSEGAVTFPVLIEAFKQATTEGGKFEGGMDKLSKTLGGVLSTLKDNLNIAFAELGKEIVNAFDLTANMQGFIDFIKNLTERFKSLDPQTKKIIIGLGALAAALPPLLIVLGSMSSGLGVLVSVGGSLIPILAKVATGFRVLGVALVSNPFGIAVAGIVAVTAAVTELMHRLAPSASRLTTLKNIFLSLGNPTKFAALQAESLAKSQAEVATETTKVNTALEDEEKLLKESADASNNLTTKNKEATVATRELAKAVSAISLSTQSGELNYTTGEFAQADIARGAQTISVPLDIEVPTPEAINEKLKGSLDKLKETTKETAEAINIDFGNMAMGVAEALGSAIASGENVFASIGGVILNSIADILFQMGTAAVAASNLATTFAIPGVGLAAGLAAIGLGAAMKAAASQIQNVQKFAKGGIVSAPTLGLMGEYSGAKSNPEVIAPLDKLKGMIGQRETAVNVSGGFRLEGQDLVMALQRAERNRSRL